MSERLNADVPVTAVASANQASPRSGDARVVLKDVLHLDSNKSVPDMLSELGCTPLITDDFWNVRHICSTADTNRRVSVVARAGPPSIALSVPVSLTPVKNSHDGPGSVPASAQRNPTPKRRPVSVGFPGGRVSRPRKQDTALSGLSRGTVGGELVEVVGGAALAPAAAANFRVLMTPGGHMDPNALRPLRALLRPLTAMVRSGLL